MLQFGTKKPATKDEAYDLLIAGIKHISERKNHDYGADNIGELGIKGVFVRIHDKVKRLKQLVWLAKTPAVEDESVQDTFLDLANYGLIALMLMTGWWDLPWKSDIDNQEGPQ